MRATYFAPSFLQKRGVLEGGWLQAGSSQFNENLTPLPDSIVNVSFMGYELRLRKYY